MGRRRLAAIAALVAVAAVALLVVGSWGADRRGARIIRFTLHSRLLHRALPVTAVIPSGRTDRPRPLLVFLHGKGEDENSNLTDAMFAALARQGARAPDVVFPYGGADSYWHDRRAGAWGSYVADEVIPAAARRLHADRSRVALGGISMGGFGALDLARLHPRHLCAVGGHSAALWPAGGDSAPGAFDDAEDFARHDVVGAARSRDPYPGVPVWLDAGKADPFRSTDALLARELTARGHRVALHVWPGGHDGAYWDAHWGAYLRFYARALARCRPG